MLVEQPLGNLEEAELSADHDIDWLDLTWLECTQCAMRKRTRGGRQIRILLKIGVVLRHLDVLFCEPESSAAVVVLLLPCQVVLVSPRDPTEAAAIAYKLGDLHLPMQIADGQIIAPCDRPIEAELETMGVSYEIQERRFEPNFRTAAQIQLADTFQITQHQ